MAYVDVRRWYSTTNVGHLDTLQRIAFQRSMSLKFDLVDCALCPSGCRNNRHPDRHLHHLRCRDNGEFAEAEQIGPR